MDLLERYLQAVKFWLPKEQKNDIIAELSEDLRSEIEEKETALGHKLSDSELSDLLKQRGRPVFVANRYLPQQHLIGPVLFPIYRLVLKIVMLCYLVPAVVVWITLMIFNSGYRAEHIGPHIVSTLGAIWGTLWSSAFLGAGVVTLVFAILERVQFQSQLEDWNPRTLPPVRKNPNLIPRSASIIELVANMVCCLWWTAYMSSTVIINNPNLQVYVSSAWHYFFWGFLFVALLNTALAASNLVRPYWTASRAAIRLVSDAAGSILFCALLKANVLVGFSAANVAASRATEIIAAINWWTVKMFPVAVVFGVTILCVNAFRIWRVKSTAPPLTKSASTVIA
jgi:hypothetical protein